MTTTTLSAAGRRQRAEDERLPGILITIDGPGGVGKSTIAQLVATALDDRAVPVHATVEPTRTPLGEHIRAGTETYRGMALACLVAGDRHHHLATEILPALRAGKVVVCDRYLPSSLVLQHPLSCNALTALTPRSSGNSTPEPTSPMSRCCSTPSTR